ncbi:hypothetical protein AZE42_07461 [Rhizopogon vesiculosus]|uniref:Cytochrome P450 n=1 Tax=Rhizopogon vesiculosus TaxID=180088 RepID=A0A1J8QPV7_9AGAM|nr:hypothetical protein AZE42_07461 [Rhizopogon vesiculosus]
MGKQSGFLADHPRLIAAGEMLSGGLSIVYALPGDRFRRMRSALHTHLRPRAAETYQPLQMSHAKNVIFDILQDPRNFQNHAKSYKNGVWEGYVHPRALALTSWTRFHGSNTSRWYGLQLKREGEMRRRIYVKEQLKINADIGPSFARYILENEDAYSLTKTEIACLASDFFATGVDTTAMAICTVLTAVARFPEEQVKVQTELDAVLGSRRAPTFGDENFLPRLYAFISEMETVGSPWKTIACLQGLRYSATIWPSLEIQKSSLNLTSSSLTAGSTTWVAQETI